MISQNATVHINSSNHLRSIYSVLYAL